jgi:3-hydroxyisobutyrate dehydrogenase-like beta-hydroxyacid dehydrogenase
MVTTVCQIGLGTVGSLYTDHLLRGGLAVSAFDLDERRTTPLT